MCPPPPIHLRLVDRTHSPSPPQEQIPDFDQWNLRPAPIPAADRDFIAKSRSLLTRGLFRLFENIANTDRVAGTASDLLGNMIRDLHTSEELQVGRPCPPGPCAPGPPCSPSAPHFSHLYRGVSAPRARND